MIQSLGTKLKEYNWLRHAYYRWLTNMGYIKKFGFPRGWLLRYKIRKKKNDVIKLKLKQYPHEVYLRRGTSDVPAFEQIFARGGYEFQFSPPEGHIIDAGAYTGLSTIFFASKFPGKKIIAIEPNDENFRILLQNTQPYENVRTYHAALWSHNTRVSIVNKDASSWAFRVEELSGGESGIEAVSIDEIMRREAVTEIAILKMDVEGAEKEIFAAGGGTWLPRVHCLIIEFHDRFKPGARQTLERILADFPHKKFHNGENEIYVFN